MGMDIFRINTKRLNGKIIYRKIEHYGRMA
jgi:hypothetical protein